MYRALKYLFRLAVLGILALAGYALLADLPPPTRTVEVDLPVPPGTDVPAPDPAVPATDPAAPAAPAETEAGIMQE